jgi:hypothetical protein
MTWKGGKSWRGGILQNNAEVDEWSNKHICRRTKGNECSENTCHDRKVKWPFRKKVITFILGLFLTQKGHSGPLRDSATMASNNVDVLTPKHSEQPE